MSAAKQNLPDHLDLIAAAPGGIQKLRGLILELAVRGKLVAQDPNDEPASELLKRIAQERARLEAEGVCKKSKPLPLVGEEEQPFVLPEGWEWVRLGEIGHDWGQKAPSEPFTYIDVSAIDNTCGKIVSPNVIAPDDAPSRARKLVRRGTVIYSTVRPYLLNIAVIDRDLSPSPIASTAFAILHPLPGLLSQFVFWYLRSPVFVRYVESVQTGIAYPAVNDAQFFSGLFPLPPLAEQHRIVAKVDELMALCDRLEAEQADSASAHARLVDTLLGTLTQSTDAADLATNWQRLAEHFDTLFTTEPSLDTLKQTVLQLAVMGKLVPQDPNDEPVSERFGGLKSLDSIPETVENLPNQWVLCQYRSLTSLVTSGSRGWKEFYSDSGAIFIRTQNIKTDNLVLDDVAFVDLPKQAEGMRSQVLQDDILITITGANVTKAARISSEIPEAYISQHIALTRPIWPEISRWLHLCFISRGSARGVLEKLAYGAKPGLSLTNIRDLVLPLPPLPEQHRIVAKVDELMALCDGLKAKLAESRQRQEQLSATLIKSALAA